MTIARIGLLFVALALAGCASRPVTPNGGVDWGRRAESLLRLSEWQADGRIAVKSGADGGQGNIQWRQRGDAVRIALRGPFGAGAWQIDWTGDGLVVTGKAGEVTTAYSGDDAVERYLADQVGWSFPARSIRYWILGIADPAFVGRVEYDADGWLDRLEQNGWIVTYDRFTDVDGRWMPGKIVMRSENARVRLVVDRWRW